MTVGAITYADFEKSGASHCWHYDGDGLTIAVTSCRADGDAIRQVYRAWYASDGIGSGIAYGDTFEAAVNASLARFEAA